MKLFKVDIHKFPRSSPSLPGTLISSVHMSSELTIDNSIDVEIDDEANDINYNAASAQNSGQDKQCSPAQTLVEVAAYRIDLQSSKLNHLLHILEEELITEVWQLHYLDSANWKDMGFPVGLVASIRRLINEKQRADRENGRQNEDYGATDSAGQFARHVLSPGTRANEPDVADLDVVGGHSNVKRISDITLSERLGNRIIMSPGMLFSPETQKFGINSSGSEIVSPKDQPPVSVLRRASSRNARSTSPAATSSTTSLNNNKGVQNHAYCPRTNMPPRPLRRPTIHETQKTMKFEIDDLSDTAESIAMDNVGMLFVGSNHERKEKIDSNNSMAVITSFNDLTKYLTEGTESTIDEDAENESKRSDGPDGVHDSSKS